MAPSSSKAANLGQIIEYLPDRLYLASYLNPPNAETLFPFGDHPVKTPSKRTHRAVQSDVTGASFKSTGHEPYYFTVDDSLLYNAFHHDFGPLHVGHLYRFALHFHEVLAATESQQRPVVFWSRADPRSRANASCLLACYMVLIQSWPPHLALAPIAQVDPPLMPFRDAGYSQADYGITVQDVVYGVWKAKEEGCCVLDNFDLAEYETYERVEHGDFNWITPNFLAFASPQHSPIARITEGSELYATLPRSLDAVDMHPTLPQPFKNVLRHFSERNIGLVVRLNSALYSPSYFEALGIQHLDMIFEDGTCPPMSTVRKFVRLAHEMINIRKKNIAVHCKAGLGRTGCLIGAYLIYRHGFTANEIISFMRFMRPGMVVGPQQHWLHLNQGVFREWWVEERVERKLRRELAAAATAAAASAVSSSTNNNNNNLPSTPIRAMQKASLGRSQSATTTTSTPPNRSVSGRSPLSEMDQERTNVASTAAQEDYLPAPTPGQPRKTTRVVAAAATTTAAADRHHPYARGGSGKTASSSNSRSATATVAEEEEGEVEMEGAGATTTTSTTTEDTEVFSRSSGSSRTKQQHRGSQASASSRGTDSEEEVYLRMRMHRKTSTTTTTAAAMSSPDHHRSPDSGSIGVSSSTSGRRHASHAYHGHAQNKAKSRSVSHSSTAAAAAAALLIDSNDASNDAENIGSGMSRVKSMQQADSSVTGVTSSSSTSPSHLMRERASSTSGVLAKVRSSDRSKRMVGAGAGAAAPAGIRKTSGRVGSAGNLPSAVTMASVARKISGMQ